MYDLLVIGGGASGLMAAGRAAELGQRVLLLEKNKRVGEKLRISGGGRCNITNAEPDPRMLLKSYGKAEQFLYSLFTQFGVKDTFNFFESRGLPLVTQGRQRVFPKSEKAEDVVNVLLSYVRKGNVAIHTGAAVTQVHHGPQGIEGVSVGRDVYRARNYLFSTGSVSHPETGSTGDGFAWLRALGHTVRQPTPTIVPLSIKEEWVKRLAGVSIEKMKITFFVEGTKKFAETGKILCTHFGVSGPLILNSAHKVADLLYDGAVTATIDAYPGVDLGALEQTILGVFDANKNKTLKNVLKLFIPEGTTAGISHLMSTEMDITKKVHLVSKDERKRLARLLKALPLTIVGLMGFDRAVVADGGVPLREVDMRTMQSKKIPNLYLTGDLLDINRPSGGYSLQLCWSSGFVAGTHSANGQLV